MKIVNVDVSLENVGQIKNLVNGVDPQDAATVAQLGGIPELTADPVAPVDNTAWVKRTDYLAGSPIGLLLSLTQASTFSRYKLSYKTLSGAIVRTDLD
jgi:hypothetical protein